MKKKIIIAILGILLLAGTSSQATIITNKNNQMNNIESQTFEPEVRVYMGFVGITDYHSDDIFAIPKDDLFINVGNGAQVTVYINYFIDDGGRIKICFDDESDSDKIDKSSGEYYGTLEISKYFGPDESFEVNIDAFKNQPWPNEDNNELHVCKGKTHYYKTGGVSINAGFIVIRGTGYSNEGIIMQTNDNYNTFVGAKGSIIDANVDYIIDCTGWTDNGFVDIEFEGGPKKSVQNDELKYGRLSVGKIFDSNQYFSLNLHAKLTAWYGAETVAEETSQSHGSTKPHLPDLEFNGNLHWNNVIKPRSTIQNSFTIKNDGAPFSELDWEITEWPDWGKWTFSKKNGQDLTPEDPEITIDVTVVAPRERQKFTGVVKVVNKDNPEDYCEIPVILSTPRNRAINNPLYDLLAQHPFLSQIFQRLLNH